MVDQTKVCKFCESIGFVEKPLSQCFECSEYLHESCVPIYEHQVFSHNPENLFGDPNFHDSIKSGVSKSITLCSSICRDKFEKFRKLFQMQSEIVNRSLDQKLQGFQEQSKSFEKELGYLNQQLQVEKEKNARLENIVEELQEKVDDLESDVEFENQQKFKTHVAISGIPGGVEFGIFFQNLLNYLQIGSIEYLEVYESDTIPDAPKDQQNPTIFVLKTEAMKETFMNAVVGKIEYGQMTPGLGKRNQWRHQKIIIRDHLTDHMASILKQARRYVSDYPFLSSAEYEDGYVRVTTYQGEIFDVNTLMGLKRAIEF